MRLDAEQHVLVLSRRHHRRPTPDPAVICKRSGPVMAKDAARPVACLRPPVGPLWETHLPDQLIRGSNGPICIRATSHGQSVATTGMRLFGLTRRTRDASPATNARHLME